MRNFHLNGTSLHSNSSAYNCCDMRLGTIKRFISLKKLESVTWKVQLPEGKQKHKSTPEVVFLIIFYTYNLFCEAKFHLYLTTRHSELFTYKQGFGF